MSRTAFLALAAILFTAGCLTETGPAVNRTADEIAEPTTGF